MTPEVIILVGGSSSGKSLLAEKMTEEYAARSQSEVYYIATGTIWDEEFARRVEKHRRRRPQHWHTIEEPLDLNGRLQEVKEKNAVILIDGIGTWITNQMYQDGSMFSWEADREQIFYRQLDQFVESWRDLRGPLLLVADEVGMDVVPDNAQARLFRDINGRVNQRLAQAADRVFLVVCGIPVGVK